MPDSGPYRFDIVGYMDGNLDRHHIPEGTQVGEAANIQDTFGLWVKATNVSDPSDVQMFWAYVYSDDEGDALFQDWAEWYVYLQQLMLGYGLELE